MKNLLKEIRACTICKDLPLGPRPIVAASEKSKIVIISQAPGSVVHGNGIAWKDKSGQNLRQWMGINDKIFYDTANIAIIPMGFCYPGRGKSGDLPPRKECAPQWHQSLLESLKEVKLTLLIGKYAQDYYLAKRAKRTLTETVKHFEDYLPEYFVLPHPSPRNNIWMAKNEWFKTEVVPSLRSIISELL